jgi:tRNA threonylcarbamoyladenosine biosynthesis protein TsaE
MKQLTINSLAEMQEFSHNILTNLAKGSMVFLIGDLGAGKTAFVRSALRSIGYQGTVKSPTYTLLETYSFSQYKIAHFDLYRLADPEELEYMGFRDFLDGETICFVEWPSQGQGFLPAPDLTLELKVEGEKRHISLQAHSEKVCRHNLL